MTEKEKAKAYDEAIGRAKKLYSNKIIEEIFPELKESEDERIKKAIIEFFESEDDNTTYSLVRKKDIIAWLEKQGKNSTDKTPKFKVGDWVVFITSGSVYQVEKKENYEYTLKNIHGGSFCVSFSNEELIREWTIQDAKDGDIIHLGTVIAIFKKYIGSEKCICYCSFCKDGGFEIPIENGEDNIYGCYNATPTTKEQCDAFMKIMKDAGYKWDAEKKELKEEKVK